MLENRETLNSILSSLTEKKAISGVSQVLAATATVGLVQSTIPLDATRAIISAEVASITDANDPTKLFRYWENGTPTATVGIIRGHGDAFSVEGRDNLDSLRFYGVEAGSTVTIQIQYYK